jgi:hypothetical protein
MGDSAGTSSGRVYFGASQDLQIYHNGSFNIIDSANDFDLKIMSGSDTMAIFDTNGAVELYHDNSKKFETSAYGTWLGDNSRITLGGTPGTPDCHFYHDATDTNIQNITGDLVIKSNSGGAKAVVVKNAAAVELYHNNSKKLETTTHGIKLGGASTVADSSADDLQIGLGTGHAGMTIYSGTSHVGAIYFADGSGANSYRGYWQYEHNLDRFVWGTANITRLVLNSDGHLIPGADNSYDLGTTGTRWRNIYTNDLHLSNEGHGNDVDGTWGSYTIQEGAEDLFLINKRNGKKYKFNLTEVN